MIPKVIHYCWFGRNPLSELAKKCIASWRKYLPDYEIKEWNEDNFDVNIIPYTAEAYKAKKYAFVSDYARFWILYKYGGLYFDTDVEVIKNMDDIIAKGPFMGCEAGHPGATPSVTGVAPGLGLGVNPGLGLGVNPGLGLYKTVLDWYDTHHFALWNGRYTGTVVKIVTDILRENGYEDMNDGIMESCGVFIYPPEYFCPKNYYTGEMNITDKTVSIHHYTATWVKQKPSLWDRALGRFLYFKVRLWSSLVR